MTNTQILVTINVTNSVLVVAPFEGGFDPLTIAAGCLTGRRKR